MSDYEYESDTEDPQPTLVVKKAFIPPCRTTKTESDIEDIVIDGIARKRPAMIRYLCAFNRHLDVDKTYKWCACGKSRDIFCDDSCGPDDLAPLEFTPAKKVTWSSLCGCRYTATPPYCDGVHYQPHLGQDEWAEEHGLELPAACRPKCCIEVENDEEVKKEEKKPLE